MPWVFARSPGVWACNKSVDQFISSFNPDPLYGYMQFSYDTLTITSTASCDINIRPDFIISHEDSAIEVGDFTIEWYNPIIQNWPEIPYTIDYNNFKIVDINSLVINVLSVICNNANVSLILSL